MNMLHLSATEFQLVIQAVLSTLVAMYLMLYYLGRSMEASQETRSLLSQESQVLVRLIFVSASFSISLSLIPILVSYISSPNLPFLKS